MQSTLAALPTCHLRVAIFLPIGLTLNGVPVISTSWPECLNCEEPAAEYKNKPGKPRLYCSDECSIEYNMFYKSYGGRKSVRYLVPHWPLCTQCGERPRAVWDDQHGYPDRSQVVKEYRRQRREAREGNVSFTETLLYKFCSTNCREEYLAPTRAFMDSVYDVDALSTFEERGLT